MEKDIQVQEAQRVPNKLNQVGQKSPTWRHIKITIIRVKDKERTLKATREKAVSYLQGTPLRLSSDVPTGTFQTRKE